MNLSKLTLMEHAGHPKGDLDGHPRDKGTDSALAGAGKERDIGRGVKGRDNGDQGIVGTKGGLVATTHTRRINRRRHLSGEWTAVREESGLATTVIMGKCLWFVLLDVKSEKWMLNVMMW
jgi:hypothetical protein